MCSTYFLEKTNNPTVMQAFNDSCTKLQPEGIKYEKVGLVVTDQASYMLLAIKNLKGMYPNINHVTCIAHALHRVSETVREMFSEFLTTLFHNLKRFFVNLRLKFRNSKKKQICLCHLFLALQSGEPGLHQFDLYLPIITKF